MPSPHRSRASPLLPLQVVDNFCSRLVASACSATLHMMCSVKPEVPCPMRGGPTIPPFLPIMSLSQPWQRSLPSLPDQSEFGSSANEEASKSGNDDVGEPEERTLIMIRLCGADQGQEGKVHPLILLCRTVCAPCVVLPECPCGGP